MKTTNLTVLLRKERGKGASRAIRKEGLLPAIIYGDNKEPVSIKITPKELIKEMHINGFSARLFSLKGDKIDQVAICKKIDFDPVSGAPIHADFLRVGKKAIKVNVGLEFTNKLKSPGLKQGGILNTLRRKITILAKPEMIPTVIEVSLEGLGFGDSIHLEDLKFPEGVKPFDSSLNFSIVAIVAPRVIEVETTETEEIETAEGEEKPDEKTEEAPDKKEEK